jgi:hypothetical protein
VLVIGLDRLVAEMIETAVEAEPSLDLIGCPNTQDPGAVIRETAPDVVVVPQHGNRVPWPWLRLLSERPMLCVLAIDADGGVAVQYRAGQVPLQLDDVSPAEIASAILRLGRGVEGRTN